MKPLGTLFGILNLCACLGLAGYVYAAAPDLPEGKPLATIDLAADDGVRLVKGQWRYSDARIVEVDFHAAGSDKQPSGPKVKTNDIVPRAGARNFDDSQWLAIAPTSLDERRGNGRLSFNWYRIRITIPQRIGDFDPTGATVVFATSVDDYAEVWVDGELPRAAGQSGGSVVRGWNAENRLIVGRDVRPGQQIQLAVFGGNGPLSSPPTNFIYLRYAKLEFHRGGTGPYAVIPQEVNVDVLRLDPTIDSIVPANPKIFKLAEGFRFTEGPIWVDRANPGGALLFSDPNANTIYRYSHDGDLSIFRNPSGYDGADIAEYGQPGSNGLTLDPQGRLTINEHGNRRVTRLDADGALTVLADRYEGKRLNSPNDLVYKSDGALYFTDPPFGLPRFDKDPRKELPFSGVFRVSDGRVDLLSRDLTGPNGIAFSPDERFLYVGNWDEKKKVVMRYPVLADGTLGAGTVFFDMTGAAGEEAIDGIKVDIEGNLYVSGPGGLWILSSAGKHLGTVFAPRHPHNMAWGDSDGKTLYLAAESGLYRMRLDIAGVRPGAQPRLPPQ
jgi:gluconolactonase